MNYIYIATAAILTWIIGHFLTRRVQKHEVSVSVKIEPQNEKQLKETRDIIANAEQVNEKAKKLLEEKRKKKNK